MISGPVEPTYKSQDIDDLIKDVFKIDRKESIKSGVCPVCHNEVGEFKDDLSRKEHSISGLCQACQDEIFTESDE